MSDGTHLTTWVPKDTRTRFTAVAQHQGLTESALLKRLIDLMLHLASAGLPGKVTERVELCDQRLTVRLPPDDRRLLTERAAARSVAPATYVSILLRGHLRALTPFPKRELDALKQSVSALGQIGRRLKTIAAVARKAGQLAGPGREDLKAILQACEALRDHVKDLVRVNQASWERGYGESN